MWLDDHQYKVLDTSSTSTAGDMRRVMGAKTGNREGFDVLLEISWSNGGKINYFIYFLF